MPRNQFEKSCRKKRPKKRIFVLTPFYSLLKLEKKFYARKPLAFSLHFLFLRDQNYQFSLTSKILKKIVNKTSKEKPINRSPATSLWQTFRQQIFAGKTPQQQEWAEALV